MVLWSSSVCRSRRGAVMPWRLFFCLQCGWRQTTQLTGRRTLSPLMSRAGCPHRGFPRNRMRQNLQTMCHTDRMEKPPAVSPTRPSAVCSDAIDSRQGQVPYLATSDPLCLCNIRSSGGCICDRIGCSTANARGSTEGAKAFVPLRTVA